MDEAFYALVDKGEDIASVADAQGFLQKLAVFYGVQNLGYLGLNIPSVDGKNGVLDITTYPLDWVARYRAKNYHLIDPVVPQVMGRLLPLDWQDITVSTNVARRFFGEAFEHGIQKQGLAIPIRGVGARDWQVFKQRNIPGFLLVAFYFHQQIMTVRGVTVASEIRQLSQRERDILWWTAEGKTSKEIAIILGLSDRTVRFYIENALTKLRCHSKAQLVAKARRLGLL